MPKTPHLLTRGSRRRGARLHHHFVTQRPMEGSQQPSGQPRNYGNHDPLAVAEALRRVVHRAILQFATCFVADSERLAPTVTTGMVEGGVPLPPLCAGNSEMDAFLPARLSGIPILIMSTHKIAFTSRDYSLPRSGSKPSLDAKLDRVFQMAEHMDAKCVYMFDAATHKRRPGFSAR